MYHISRSSQAWATWSANSGLRGQPAVQRLGAGQPVLAAQGVDRAALDDAVEQRLRGGLHAGPDAFEPSDVDVGAHGIVKVGPLAPPALENPGAGQRRVDLAQAVDPLATSDPQEGAIGQGLGPFEPNRAMSVSAQSLGASRRNQAANLGAEAALTQTPAAHGRGPGHGGVTRNVPQPLASRQTDQKGARLVLAEAGGAPARAEALRRLKSRREGGVARLPTIEGDGPGHGRGRAGRSEGLALEDAAEDFGLQLGGAVPAFGPEFGPEFGWGRHAGTIAQDRRVSEH